MCSVTLVKEGRAREAQRQNGYSVPLSHVELARIAVVWDIPIACNRTSADYLITSPLLRHARRAGRRPVTGARA